MADRILLDIRSCTLTMGQVLKQVELWRRLYPDSEIFMDGDEYAIVARRRTSA